MPDKYDSTETVNYIYTLTHNVAKTLTKLLTILLNVKAIYTRCDYFSVRLAININRSVLTLYCLAINSWGTEIIMRNNSHELRLKWKFVQQSAKVTVLQWCYNKCRSKQYLDAIYFSSIENIFPRHQNCDK